MVTIICVDSIYTLFVCKKGIHWSINGTGIMGWGWGHFCVFEHFCFFFRSLALVFQKSPTRNKEATRFTLIVGIDTQPVGSCVRQPLVAPDLYCSRVKRELALPRKQLALFWQQHHVVCCCRSQSAFCVSFRVPLV